MGTTEGGIRAWETRKGLKPPKYGVRPSEVSNSEYCKAVSRANPRVWISKTISRIKCKIKKKAGYKHYKTDIPFKTMTLEHNNNIGEECREESRDMLNSKGYVALFTDVKFYPRAHEPGENGVFEDWWINPSYFSEEVVSKSGTGLYFDECTKRL